MQMGAEDPAKIDKLVRSPDQLERVGALYKALAPLMEQDVISTHANAPRAKSNSQHQYFGR